MLNVIIHISNMWFYNMAGIYCTAASLLLLFSSFWHCLYCFDPLLSFVGCCSLEKVVSVIWGYDLKEVSFNLIFFGWAREKMKKREIKGISWRETADSKQQLYFMVMSLSQWGSDMGHVYPVTTVSLTIWHKLHSCNHRPTEMDGTQRVITLTQRKKGDTIR